MRTYGELFRVPEFRPLFAASAVQIAAMTVSGLALSTLVYAATGSPLLAALALFGSSFAQVVGATVLLSAADRLPPRTALVTVALVFSLGTLGLAVPGMPILGMFLLIFGLGLVNSVTGGIRWGLLGEIVPDDGYVLARSVFNMLLGVMQIGGYALGGVLVVLLAPRQALLVSAGLYLLAAAVLRLGLAARPPRAAGRPSPRETWRVNRRLWSLPARRHIYLALWVPNGLIVGCEALFVPYATTSAGTLFMATALGMLAGDTVVGRFVPRHWRPRLITPLRLLLAAPILLFALPLPLPVAALILAVAAVGFSAGLLLQDLLIALSPADARGQVLGLHTSGLLTMQAVGATIAGLLAQWVPTGTAMALMAVASLLVTLALTPALRRPVAAGQPESVTA
ncbi:MFS transporter [Micromonospora rifamycinica]|uniref:MFS transporter n=1 Tax=Micromonospora rifamycinica TaxID=291594 RepID=UPI002E2D2ACB|nr:MFS transporter [Micromonospora rifamycinica]